ncbi:hypothetical protein CFE70_002806 [Pyrenophora teres f. teres 0-1]|uniref:Uncharacterized protein n=1 Tax=Pyrenophora teres f. teres (strain 0-1) TaxID=861557 RepID=E3RY47_PYRTT|nr:hypothetical protein PTT_14426 [Pyrenophora teres f. teres 0-1]
MPRLYHPGFTGNQRKPVQRREKESRNYKAATIRYTPSLQLFYDVVATGRLVIKQAIKSSQFDDAQWALKVIRRLPSNTRVRRKYFFNVIKTVKDITIQAIKDNKLDDAKSALDIIQQLTDISTIVGP